MDVFAQTEASESETELRERYMYSNGESLDQSDVSKASLDQISAELLEAVKNGDIDLVKSKLDDEINPVNINAVNSDGDSALKIAVDRNDFEIMTVLLDKGADITLALLQSIYDNKLECVKVLLSRRRKVNDVPANDGITPTVLAAQLGHHEILNFLIENDYLIEEPHSHDCECNDCCRLLYTLRRRSQITINRFRGLSSPVYMCLRYLSGKGSKMDPFSQAFELNKRLRRQAQDEPVLKKQYLELSNRCTTFTTDLYNCCNSMDEIFALFDIDYIVGDRPEQAVEENRATVMKRIRRAIESDHKEFVAHPDTQELLNFVVYAGVGKSPTKSIFLKALIFILYTIFFPLLALIYVLFPRHRISRMMTTPFLKFVSHTSQFFVFFLLNVTSALRDNHSPTSLEKTIIAIVLGMIIQEIMEMRRHVPRTSYFFKWWNITTLVMLTLFVLSFLSWFIGFTVTGGSTVVDLSQKSFDKGIRGYHFLLLSNSFFSLGIIASVFHMVDLCQVFNSVSGPLQLSLYRMLQDVFKFLLFFAAIFVAFVLGLRNLYSYYNSIQAEMVAHSNKNFSIKAERNHQFSSLTQSTLCLFWALFDEINLEDFDTTDKTFDITQKTGKILFAIYCICAVLVAVNMLIAMMAKSYDTMSEYADYEWRFIHTQQWLDFAEKGTLPAPYNLLPNPYAISNFFKSQVAKKRGMSRMQEKSEKEIQQKRKKIMKRIIHRFFAKQKFQRKKEASTVQDIEESKSEIINALKRAHNDTSLLNLRQ